jgi:ectoine hydroxylase-related dioxygenase (phytanoyl-CoA dioxygenase family)
MGAFDAFKRIVYGQPSPPATLPETETHPQIQRRNAKTTSKEELISIIERDGGVIVEKLISTDLAARIKADLEPYFKTDIKDESGFFPETTKRASGLLGISDACVELACNKTFIDVANQMLTSVYTGWTGQEQETWRSKPIISSTVAFRVNPGGKQQGLHRDDRYVQQFSHPPHAHWLYSAATTIRAISICQ